MKKKLLFLSAIASMLFATSCSQEEDFAIVADGTEVAVSFSLTQPEISTRAYSEGSQATNLTYAVYETGSKTALIYSGEEGREKVTFTNKKANLTLNLVKGKSYDILFWADAPVAEGKTSPYTFDPAAQTISVNYEGVLSNDESRDAFFAAVEGLEIKGASQQGVELKRPFAQLNLGATDTDAAADIDFVATKTQVVVKSYATLNLLSGEVVGEATDVTFGLAPIPGEDETFPATGVTAQYLAMNYLLVNDKELVKVEFTVSNGSHTFTNTYSNVPVQRNHRTNIYGSLLTNATDFTITIEEEYGTPSNTVIIGTPGSFENDLAMINASTETNVTIILGGDIEINTLETTGNSYLLTREGVNLTIDGNGHTITAVGEGIASICASEKGSLTIKNATIKDNSQSYAEDSWKTGYLELGGDLTLEKCNITNAIQFNGTSLVVNDCDFNSNNESEYALWIYSGTAEVKDSYFTGARAIKICDMYTGADVTNVVIDACTFEDLSKKPGVAIDERQGETMTVTIKNSTFTNTQAGDQGNFIYETDNVVPTLENNIVAASVAEGVFYNKTEDMYLLSNANGLKWFATNPQQNMKVTLAADIDLTGENWTPINSWNGVYNGLVLDGAGHTIKNMTMEPINGVSSYGFFNNNASSMTIKNLTFDNAVVDGRTSSSCYAGVVIAKNYSPISIENVHVTNSVVMNNWQCGGLVGFAETNAPTFVKCTISNSFVGGSNATAGILFGLGVVDVTFTECEATNVNVYTDMELGWVGYIYGKTLTATNCVMTNINVVSQYPTGY